MIYWTMNSVPELVGLDKAEKKKSRKWNAYGFV